jgi:hypothetical protein
LPTARPFSEKQSKNGRLRWAEKPQVSILPCLILFMHDFRNAEKTRADLEASALHGLIEVVLLLFMHVGRV